MGSKSQYIVDWQHYELRQYVPELLRAAIHPIVQHGGGDELLTICSRTVTRCNPSRCSIQRRGRTSPICSITVTRFSPSRCSIQQRGRTSPICSITVTRCNPSRCSTRRRGRPSPICSITATRFSLSRCSIQQRERTSPICSTTAPRFSLSHCSIRRRGRPSPICSITASRLPKVLCLELLTPYPTQAANCPRRRWWRSLPPLEAPMEVHKRSPLPERGVTLC